MRTYGRNVSGSTRERYPAACDYCGVVWERKELRRDTGGRMACPDDYGRDRAYLDKMNAARGRYRRQPKGPFDGVTEPTAVDPVPLSPIGGGDTSGTLRVVPGDMMEVFGALLHAWFRAQTRADFEVDASDLVSGWRNRTSTGDATQATPSLYPTYEATGFNGQPCVTSEGTRWISSALNLTLSAGSRPYVMIVGRQNELQSAQDIWLNLRDATGSLMDIGLDASNNWRFRLVGTGSVLDTITVNTANTGRHLLECGFRSATANRAVVDGTGASGAQTTGASRAMTHLSLFTLSTIQIPPASLAEVILLSDIPTDQQLVEARGLLASSERGYGLSLA